MNRITKKFFKEITFFGGIFFYLFVAGVLYLSNQKEYALKIFIGLILIYAITFIIRIFYFKQRPHKEEYDNFLEKVDSSSFPSVHAARITLLFLFSMLILSSISIKLLALIVFFLVLYSRIYLKKHYIADIIGGIILGIVSFISSLYSGSFTL